MLDRYVIPLLRRPLAGLACKLETGGCGADGVSAAGFGLGLACVVAVSYGSYGLALVLLLLNRLADGIDGELARRQGATDAGGFLDISLDFIFYALFPLGFALAEPATNALPAATLIASFVGTGASFLAFASVSHRQGLEHPEFAYKGLYYLNGLAEGTETVLCFVFMCLLPQHFPVLAYGFAAVCAITAANRVVFGYRTLRRQGVGRK